MPTASPTPGELFRYRIRFAKGGSLRWTGHLDLQTTWRRTLRRAGLAVAYSAGFHPQPRLIFAAALPLGFTSSDEQLDLWLKEYATEAALTESVHGACPPGLEVLSVNLIDLRAPSISASLRASDYEVRFDPAERAPLEQGIAALLAATTAPRERRGKHYDLRPLIHSLSIDESEPVLRMRLAAGPSATGRPDEVLAQLGLDPADFLIHRAQLVLEHADADDNQGQ